MYPKVLDFNVRIASAPWFTLVTWMPSTFSFVQVILFRVCDRGRTLNLSETKPWMSDPDLRILSLRLVGFIPVIIHGSVEEQWIFWRHSHTHTHTQTNKHTHTHTHTHTACITSCCKNVNAYTNFISTVLFSGIENCCRCATVGLWYGTLPFSSFCLFFFFLKSFCFYFSCLFIVSFLYFFCFFVCLHFNFHIFHFLSLSFISSIFPSFF